MPLRGNVLRRGSRVDSSSTNAKLAIKDSAQQQQQKKCERVCECITPLASTPYLRVKSNLDFPSGRTKAKPYVYSEHSQLILDACAKQIPWLKLVLENWSALTPTTFPLLAHATVQTCLQQPPLGALFAWPNRLCYMGCCHHVCVCVYANACVCVFGPSSTWLLQPPAQGTKGNTRLISSLL